MFFYPSSQLLSLCFISQVLSTTASNECTEGFMDYELLKQKASQISPQYGSLPNNDLTSTDFGWSYVMPTLSFNCSGTITGFLLGVRVVVDGNNNRNQYPRIIVYNVTGTDAYSMDSQRDIILGANDFSTSGLFKFTLSSPIQYSANQVIGAFQPNSDDSVVKLFYQPFTGQNIDRLQLFLSKKWFTFLANSRPLIYPITDSNCLNGFISPEELKEQARLTTNVDNSYFNGFGVHRYYEDIKFTCNGNITHIIVGAEDNTNQQSNPPEIRIWRANGGAYVQSGPSIQLYYNNAAQDVSTEYLRWYNLSEPVPVQQGDILGIYQLVPASDDDSIIYYQQYSGPTNYYGTDGQSTGYNLYPLVSVVVEISTTATTTATVGASSPGVSSLNNMASSSSGEMSITSSGDMTTSTSNSAILSTINSVAVSTINSVAVSVNSVSDYSSNGVTVNTDTTTATETNINTNTQSLTNHHSTVTNQVTISNSMASPVATTMASERTNDSENASSLITGVVTSLTVLLAIAIITVIIILVILRRRKNKMTNNLFDQNGSNAALNYAIYQSTVSPRTNDALLNPMYDGRSVDKEKSNIYEYLVDEPATYEIPQKSLPYPPTESLYSEPNAANTINSVSNGIYMYESVNANGQPPLYNVLESGLYVPTIAQREQLDQSGKEEDIYGKLTDTQYSSLRAESRLGFFTEEPIYWNPENNTKSIYEQLAQKRYREIPRQEIKVTDHLGSGQFGTVDRGEWSTPKGVIEVAIKTLKGLATEEEEIQFLQEAAINGQFRHPNVVQLCGVVTVGQPIMIVLEYVTRGDLRSFLLAIRPVPGQLPDDSLSSLLLTFSHQVACGMNYLSRKRFVHRDLAARNILVANGTVCKIADFGMSRNLQNEAYYTSNSKKIPVKWTAPEALHYRKYSSQSDVWSFGATLYEIWSVGHKPFEQYQNQKCIQLVDSGYRLPSPPGCPRAVYEIMIKCWHPISADRPSFGDIQSLLSHSQSLVSKNDHSLSNLGGNLCTTADTSLYPDLQNQYINQQ